MADALHGADPPDLDLFEYVLLSAPNVEGLAPVAGAILALVRAGSIHIVDAVLLTRPDARATVRTASPDAHHELAELSRAVDGGPRLSTHDIELVALTLAPHEAALLLLVEDRWAGALAAAAREGGARVGPANGSRASGCWSPLMRTVGSTCSAVARAALPSSTRSSRCASSPGSSSGAYCRSTTTKLSGAGCSRADPVGWAGAARPATAPCPPPRPVSCSRASGR